LCGDPRTAIYEARGLKHYKYFNKYSSVKASRPPDATNMVDISALAIRTFLENKFFVSIATAGVIVATGIIAAHFLSRVIGIAIAKFGWKEKFQKFGIKNPARLIETMLNYLIYVTAFVMALQRLGIFKEVFALIGAVVIGLLVIAAYLEFRDTAANFIAYFFVRGLGLKIGEAIKISGVEGKVKKVGLLEVALMTEDNDTIIIPNMLFVKSKVHRTPQRL